jgi:heptosyltransferase-2
MGGLMGFQTECRWFSGYKPCKFKRSCDECPHFDKPEIRIAVVSLEALGAVLRSTCLLPAIKRKYPNAHISWITYGNAKALLAGNPLIDRLIIADDKTSFLLQHLKFDLLYGVDKSMEAGALVEIIDAKEKFGFGLDLNGAIRPLTPHADYQYKVGLDDQLKFYDNQKAETQQLTESMNLEWKRDPYVFSFSQAEQKEIKARRKSLNAKSSLGIIGYNTGCSTLFPNKKLTIEKSIQLVKAWRTSSPNYVVALLGGREDAERNEEIYQHFVDDQMVVNTPNNQGLRSGVMWVDCCDLVFSGCSLGMHIAIALQKKVVAWYGVSCAQEVDLYDRGAKVQSPVSCSPCWKKQCDEKVMCYDRVEVEKIVEASKQLLSTD